MEDSQLSVDQVLSETADSIEKIQTVLSRPNIGPDDKKLLQAMLEDARRRQRAAQRAKLDALMSLDTPDVVHVGDEKPKEPVASTSGVSKGVCQPVVIQDDEEEEEHLERGGRGHPPTKVQGRKRPCDIQESKRTKKPKNFPSLSDEERLDPSYDPLNLDVEERDDDEGQSAVAVTVQPKRGRGARGRGRGGKSSTPRGRGRGRGRGSSRATTSETPNKPPAPATPSSRPKIKRLSWCSSSSETEGPPVSHKYTKGEMEIIYNTAWEDR